MDIDTEILNLLKINSRMSFTEIALRLNISCATVKTKFDSLIEKNHILKFTIVTKTEEQKIAWGVQAFLMIKFGKNGNISDLNNLPNMQSKIFGMWGVSGAWDCIILTLVPSFLAIAQLRRAVKAASDIERIETSAVLDCH